MKSNSRSGGKLADGRLAALEIDIQRGERTKALADKYEVSQVRVLQIRRAIEARTGTRIKSATLRENMPALNIANCAESQKVIATMPDAVRVECVECGSWFFRHPAGRGSKLCCGCRTVEAALAKERRRYGKKAPLPGFPKVGQFSTVDDVTAYFNVNAVTCLLCGREFVSLAAHVHYGHGMAADEYRQRYGIPQRYGLVGAQYRERLIERQSVFMASVPEEIKIAWLDVARTASAATSGERLPLVPVVQDKMRAAAAVMNASEGKREAAARSQGFAVLPCVDCGEPTTCNEHYAITNACKVRCGACQKHRELSKEKAKRTMPAWKDSQSRFYKRWAQNNRIDAACEECGASFPISYYQHLAMRRGKRVFCCQTCAGKYSRKASPSPTRDQSGRFADALTQRTA